jgi:hypothetical protein
VPGSGLLIHYSPLQGYCQLVGRPAAEHAVRKEIANLSGKALQHRSARHALPRLEGLRSARFCFASVW